jgi:hypothetical protein
VIVSNVKLTNNFMPSASQRRHAAEHDATPSINGPLFNQEEDSLRTNKTPDSKRRLGYTDLSEQRHSHLLRMKEDQDQPIPRD